MKILALEKEVPGITAADFTPEIKKTEALRVWALYQCGVIREMNFRTDLPLAVMMLEFDSLEEAQEWLDTLPMVENGLISFDLIPLMPYPGFARLFNLGMVEK